MGSETGTGEIIEIPEDTIDLSERLDPVRTLLRRIAGGDHRAAQGLVDLLAPRVHGLAVHVTGSTARAERVAIAVLRSCLRDAGQLATGGLPGEVAVLDRARRAAVATSASGTVRSLVGPEAGADRTRDRREVDVQRVLLTLPPAERALVESAAQGRFPYGGSERCEAAAVLATALERLVPAGAVAGTESSPVRSLAALDALALADPAEQAQLARLTAAGEAVLIHRRAIEAAARLTLLTAVTPSRDLRVPVLEGFPAAHLGGAAGAVVPPTPAAPSGASGPSAASAPSAPSADAAPPVPAASPAPGAAPGTEAAYRGSYATPVLGTDTQRRLVGPPAVAGLRPSAAAEPSPPAPPLAPATGPAETGAAPAFAYTAADEAQRSRRERKRLRQQERAARRRPRGVPWFSRAFAVLALAGVLVLGYLLLETREDLARTEDFTAAWAAQSMDPSAEMVPGVSDNGLWQAVLTDEAVALRAEGVHAYEGEVLQLWGERGGTLEDLGVLELRADGTIEMLAEQGVDRLLVTREMAPQNMSGTPSERIVASLDPEH